MMKEPVRISLEAGFLIALLGIIFSLGLLTAILEGGIIMGSVVLLYAAHRGYLLLESRFYDQR